jgi:hypothetical protein
MKLKYSYDSVGEVPQEFKDFYTEQEGKFILTGEIDVEPQAKFDELKTLKKNVFDENHSLKEQLSTSQKEALESKSRVEVLELQIKDGADPAKLQELVDTKVKVATEELTKQLSDKDGKIAEFQNAVYGAEKDKLIGSIVDNFSDSVKDEASFILGNIFERQEDGTFLTKNSFGLDAGLNSEQVISKLTELRPHWQKRNVSGGATGSTGGNGGVANNPFSKKTYNLTEQHKLYQENPAEYERLKSLAVD